LRHHGGGALGLDGFEQVAVDDRLMLSSVNLAAVDDLAEVPRNRVPRPPA
jgi:hypothetical protein